MELALEIVNGILRVIEEGFSLVGLGTFLEEVVFMLQDVPYLADVIFIEIVINCAIHLFAFLGQILRKFRSYVCPQAL